MDQNEIRERIEHKDALINLRAILSTRPGQDFFRYLFKSFDVGELPEIGLTGEFLSDKLGFLRAGNSLFKLATEADLITAARLLAEVEKERYREKMGIIDES